MSGGSLDYFYSSDDVSSKDLKKLGQAIDRVSSLSNEGKIKNKSVYLDLINLETSIYQSKKIFENLKDVLHDIEWEMSGDYTESQLIESINKYESNNGF